MLFNSYSFIFLFLPVVLLGYFQLGRFNPSFAAGWLALASLFFYGYWNPAYVGLLLGSIISNFAFGIWIAKAAVQHNARRKKHIFIFSIAANLLLLAYFKYANFFIGNINDVAGTQWSLGEIILPLGISFFTFTQIAFLADTYQGKVKEYNFIHYALFVTYFPHLIAGPILHHKEMMPQFAKRNVCYINWDNLSAGCSVFVLGLAKKVLIADSMALFSTPIFNNVASGGQPTLFESWIGVLAYTLQLYFDFSGYSDMAIGLSLMFNVRLPMNFNSPYKATSIIDFWRRWHMTLSRFLRDYLYIPLGGSRNGKAQRYLNLMVTMLLGGLWHGAGWTFVIWGGLHGFYLMVNQAWRGFKQHLGWSDGGRLARLVSGALTFLAVVVGWVFFRADSFSSAITILHGMAGMNGISFPTSLENDLDRSFALYDWLFFLGLTSLLPWCIDIDAAIVLAMGFAVIWLLPNVLQLFHSYRPTCEDLKESKAEALSASLQTHHGKFFSRLDWQPTKLQAISYGILFFLVIVSMASAGKSEFLYFQF
jgi:alginate O-acetyltransferase complex protein AlgI